VGRADGRVGDGLDAFVGGMQAVHSLIPCLGKGVAGPGRPRLAMRRSWCPFVLEMVEVISPPVQMDGSQIMGAPAGMVSRTWTQGWVVGVS